MMLAESIQASQGKLFLTLSRFIDDKIDWLII